MHLPLAIPGALAAATLGLATLGVAGSAAAEPPVNIDGTGHVHHVWRGDGTCLQIDAVHWDAVSRGLHQGANSSTSATGPWHGPCPG